MINADLYTYLKAYSAAAIGTLASLAATGHRVQTLYEERWEQLSHSEHPETDTFARQTRSTPLWGVYYREHRDMLSALEQYEPCVRALESDPLISPQLGVPIPLLVQLSGFNPSPSIDSHGVMLRVVTDVLAGVVNHQGRMGFDEQAFDREYGAMEDAFRAEYVTVHSFAPLVGFASEASFILLEDNLTVVRLSDQERLACAHIGEAVFEEKMVHGVPAFGIKITHRFPKTVGGGIRGRDPQEDAIWADVFALQSRASEVLCALSAYRRGGCWAPETINYTDSWFRKHQSPRGQSLRLPRTERPYMLDTTAAEGLPVFWWELHSQGVSAERYLDVAVRRLRYAVERERPDDKLIDLIVAAEALFLNDTKGGDGRRGQGQKLANRIAAFIAGSTEEYRIVRARLDTSYRARNAIMHGDRPSHVGPLTDDQLEELTTSVEEDVRTALRRMIRLAADPLRACPLVNWEELIPERRRALGV